MMDCIECKEQMYPSDPSVPYYNRKYGWRIPSFCEVCPNYQTKKLPVEEKQRRTAIQHGNKSKYRGGIEL